MTENQLRAWLRKNRPELGLRKEGGKWGIYRKSYGPAADFSSIGTLAQVARHLGAQAPRMRGN